MRDARLKNFVALVLLLLTSCEQGTLTPTSDTPVKLFVSFAQNPSASFSSQGLPLMEVDSVRIDSAIVVLKRIKFESRIDSAGVDTSDREGEDDRDEDGEEDDVNVQFKGPFVVHVRDEVAIDLGERLLPAGTYTAIKVKIHRLRSGEPREDSDEHKHGYRITPDSLPVGSSIIVCGAVMKNGEWVPFAFRFNEDLEFKIRGTFLIPSATSTVRIALNFNMQLWFRNPETGALLDPTDASYTNRSLFRRAIHIAFGKGRGAHDDDEDGYPDD